ncbi:MAG: hypothetical protein WDA08_12175 [Weeksellaceae bacterium]
MKLNFFFLLLLFPITLFAQDQPYLEYNRGKFSTGPHPKIVLVFPGCESFKENNDSLNLCFGRKLGSLIAHKLDKQLFRKITDNSNYYKNKLNIHVKTNGKLKLSLMNRLNTKFENKLLDKLTEISEEVEVIPAKYERNYCAPFNYSLPLVIELSEDEISQ